MNYTENFEGIKLDVQAVDINVDEQTQQRIRELLARMLKFYAKISHADIYLEEKSGKSTNQRSVSIRLGISGNDPFASDSGDNFLALLASVEKKLLRQLEKR